MVTSVSFQPRRKLLENKAKDLFPCPHVQPGVPTKA